MFGPIEFAMYASEVCGWKRQCRDSWLANGIANRAPKHLAKFAIYLAKVFGSMIENARA